MHRCAWLPPNNKLYQHYHDTEWGVHVTDDTTLFEFLLLEGAQAGLSWETILKRREGYRKAFANFDARIVATFDETKKEELRNNPEIIRNKLKIKSAVQNAQVFLAIQKEFGSFYTYQMSFMPKQRPIKNSWESIDKVPVNTEISDAFSKELKKRGMSFVGSTIMYAYMQAVGMVNDHTTDCFRYTEESESTVIK